ncbi:MAG: DMT family transporter [Rubricella sp.]
MGILGPLMNPNLRGALLMIGGMGAFRGNDAAMKAVLQDIPFAQAITLRGALAVLFVGAVAWMTGAIRRMPTRRQVPLVTVTTLGELGAAVTFLAAIAVIPLSSAVAILQGVPLVLTVAGAVVFGERIGWRRWAAVSVGLVGVLLILRPGADTFRLASLLVIATVLCVSTRDIVARKLGTAVPALVLTLFTSVAITVLGIVLSAFEPWGDVSVRIALMLALSAALVSAAVVMVVSAVRTGEISAVVPFRYSALIWGGLYGFILFDEVPGAYELAGAAIVAGAGLFILFRERKVAR